MYKRCFRLGYGIHDEIQTIKADEESDFELEAADGLADPLGRAGDVLHRRPTQVGLRSTRGTLGADLTCARNYISDSDLSVFTCN